MRSPILDRPKFDLKIRRDNHAYQEVLRINTVDDVELRGGIGAGYLNGVYIFLFEFKGSDGHEYRWIFDQPIPERSIDLIKAGLRFDPGYREQFRKPAAPAKEFDAVELSRLIERAFGPYSLDSNGSIEPGHHCWESRLRIVLSEPLPAEFAAFVRECKFLSLSKIRHQECITVTAPLTRASAANLQLVKMIEDFSSGALGSLEDYTVAPKSSNTWPTKPEVVSPKAAEAIGYKSDRYPTRTLEEAVMHAREAVGQQEFIRRLSFLKAGRDQYSGMKIEALEQHLGQEAVDAIKQVCQKPENQLKAMRWAMRGLTTEEAIMKVKIDLEAIPKILDRKNASRDYDRMLSDFSR